MRLRVPKRTIRARLTMLYGLLFLLSSMALLAITYGLVVRATRNVVFAGQIVIGTTPPDGAARPEPGPTNTPPGLTPEQVHHLEALARQQHNAELHQLLLQSAIALAIMALVSLAIGWVVAGLVMRPVRTIIGNVQQISATNLHARLGLT